MSDPCKHHWVLSAPDDEVIRGRCKNCGAQREYPASLEGASRQGLYEEAASLSSKVAYLQDSERVKLPATGSAW